jgi:carboxymethylenebutenolidase
MATLTVPTADGPLPLYDARPGSEATAAVVVIQEAFGVNAHIEDVSRRFALAGYRAVAPHLFHRTGDPSLSYADLEAIRPHMQALTAAGITTDLTAALNYLTDDGFPSRRVGMVGFCMGGSITMYGASQFDLGAAVTFYGGGVAEGRFGLPPLIDLAPALRAPWLGLFGDLDAGIPVDQVEALRTAAEPAPVPTDVVRYPDAGHGFHCDARTQSYHEPSAKDAWRRTLDWFARYLQS